MLNFKPVTVQDKTIINSYLNLITPHIIEQSFNTLFPWQQPHAFMWAIFQEDWLLIKTTYRGVTSFLPPVGIGDMREPLAAIADYCKAQELPFILSDVGEQEKDKIVTCMPDFFYVKSDRNAANYVYLVKDLINLSGKRYHQKKNHLNSFRRSYPDFEFLPITRNLVPDCKLTLERWCEENNCTLFPTLAQERQAILVMLDNLGDLDYFGVCIAINGRIEAFSIGEILNNNTIAILIEKANNSVKGLYTAINQMFLANYWQDFQYVNRAEDLGLANLRKTKLSYYPCYLEMKYILRPYNQVIFKPSYGEGL